MMLGYMINDIILEMFVEYNAIQKNDKLNYP